MRSSDRRVVTFSGGNDHHAAAVVRRAVADFSMATSSPTRLHPISPSPWMETGTEGVRLRGKESVVHARVKRSSHPVVAESAVIRQGGLLTSGLLGHDQGMTTDRQAIVLPSLPADVASGASVRRLVLPVRTATPVEVTVAADEKAQAAAAPSQSERWTIMVYMAADNNLEEHASADLNEMESVALPESVHVAVLLDRSPVYSQEWGNWSDTRHGVIQHDNNSGRVTSTLVSVGELNTSSSGTLADFIRWSSMTQPADHYALVIWGHGGGIYGTCADESSGDYLMPVHQMSRAIASSGIHFDLVGFDTCLQGMVEQAVDLASYTDVVVASEEDIPADGWDYKAWLGRLAQQPAIGVDTLARYAVTDYAASYRGVETPVTLSAIRTDRLSDLTAAINRFVTAAQEGTDQDWQAMRAARGETISFPVDDSWHFLDLGDYMRRVTQTVGTATIATAAGAVQQALRDSVLQQMDTQYGADSVTGLSVYLPASTPVSFYSEAKWRFLRESNWDLFAQTLASGPS
ncbi:MAG: hypothetical protein HQL58_05765 [Magnetococcales bacterium]|nr:hypothetical protein [Magnetococcales bacterium]